MRRFRAFLEDNPTLAPAMGSSPQAPAEPEKNFDVGVPDQELDIDKATRDTVDVAGEMIVSNEPIEFPGHGIKAAPPIFIRIDRKHPDGSADVTVMYSMCNRQKLRNVNGFKFEAPVADKPAHLPKQQLDRIRLKVFDQPMGGMTGAPPPGGPGGMSPPGGGMGGPPGGGGGMMGAI
jgi:hypothetical protein